ncbi:MAG: methyltransferase [Rhodospirillaceae bacterium]|nr:MAG: methyltransferase [Rhodospirillaceae bacterium]
MIGFSIGTPACANDKIPRAIMAAVADSGRPDADRQRDEHRKPAEVVAFAGLKRGDKIADLIPGGGYFTRIFSKVVGKHGHVYAVVPSEILQFRATAAVGIKAIAADKAYGNTSVILTPIAEFKAPAPLDMVWTSDNYHDLKIAFMGPADTVALDKAIFEALKPGGIFLVLDHVAAPGSGARDAATLHRIDPDLVKTEVTAAGFVLEAESDVLRNPQDDHTAKVFDTAIEGKTDQFVFRFRKPETH